MIKINKQKETVLLPKYMRSGEYEEHQGQKFVYEGMDFHIVKSNNSWCITEPKTRKFIVSWRKTRKQVIEEFEKFMNDHLELIKEKLSHF